MIRIEKKILKNNPFFYLTEQINLGKGFKKIQVYIGKNIPNDPGRYYDRLRQKEQEIIFKILPEIFTLDKKITAGEFKRVEEARLKWKYWLAPGSEAAKERLWRSLAIQFIYESNAIEGSRLSPSEVENIVRRGYIRKNAARNEVREVENSIWAFNFIRSDKFKLNQRAIIALQAGLIKGLGIDPGFKKKEIVVNNKRTTRPGQIRKELSVLLDWWRHNRRKKLHPMLIAARFHERFEIIHPFSDGNGRVGRLILNWMLIQSGYGPIIIRNRNRRAYFTALDQADNGRFTKLYRFCFESYRQTIDQFIK